MRIALVNPKQSGHLPLSCLYLASWWSARSGHDVRVVDANWEDPVEFVKHEPFDVVAVSAITPDFMAARKFIFDASAVTKAKIILGGIHATVLPESAHGLPCRVIVGDGENYFGGARWSGTLDDYPALRWDLLDARYFKPTFKDGPMRRMATVPMVTSRGCPFHCTFCAAPALTAGHGVRYHSLGWIVSEWEQAFKRGANAVCVFDDNFTLRPNRLWALAHLKHKRGLDSLELTCNARVTHFTDETCEALKELNVTSVLFGWESGCARVLAELKRDSATVEQAYACIERAKKYGLDVVGSVILGARGETLREASETARFTLKCGKLGARTVFWSRLIPYPGSQEWEDGRRLRMLSAEMDFDVMRYGSHRGVPLTVRAMMAAARTPMLARKVWHMLSGIRRKP